MMGGPRCELLEAVDYDHSILDILQDDGMGMGYKNRVNELWNRNPLEVRWQGRERTAVRPTSSEVGWQ